MMPFFGQFTAELKPKMDPSADPEFLGRFPLTKKTPVIQDRALLKV
jgi:hypothetical protein